MPRTDLRVGSAAAPPPLSSWFSVLLFFLCFSSYFVIILVLFFADFLILISFRESRLAFPSSLFHSFSPSPVILESAAEIVGFGY